MATAYVVNVAPSGRAKCGGVCKGLIAKGESAPRVPAAPNRRTNVPAPTKPGEGGRGGGCGGGA